MGSKSRSSANNWEEEWDGMPEYDNVKQAEPLITATFKFRTEKDYLWFKDIVSACLYNEEKVFDGMQSMTHKQAWYPLMEKASNYVYVGDDDES